MQKVENNNQTQFNRQKLNALKDNDLIELAHAGMADAEQVLIKRYMYVVKVQARKLFLAGGDYEDLIQEGMFGLMNAVREYNTEKKVPFAAFAAVCVRNRFYTAIKAYQSLNQTPLNNYISLEDIDGEFYAEYSDQQFNPESLVIGREKHDELNSVLSSLLSCFEAKVLELYLKGLSYNEIAAAVNKSPKSVDNAVQRIRHKLAMHLNISANR